MPKSNKKINRTKEKKSKIYLDYASSARIEEANPGAIHELGVAEKNKLEYARASVAGVLSVRPNEIIFTSGATESNNLAILGLVQNFKKPHIVVTNIEHASVLEVCRYLEKNKISEVSYVAVEANGIVDPKKIKKALKKNTVLVSVMYANNEIGTIQPIREIAKEIRHFRKVRKSSSGFPATQRQPFEKLPDFPYFHTDATQAINYLSIRVETLGVDLMSFNGAKIYGPKGVGVLYVKRGAPVRKIMYGGAQEMGLRPGTENVVGALGLTRALQETEKIKSREIKRLTTLRDYFIKKINNLGSDIIVNGDLNNRLPNNINITIPQIPSDLLVIELSARGIMASAKSACKSGDGSSSHVIEAINPKPSDISDTDGSLRFSMGRDTTKQDIDRTIEALTRILKKLKKWYN